MEIKNEAERLLVDNLNKCRCCFRMLIDDRKVIAINEDIRSTFLELTQIELLDSPELFSERICEMCVSDMKTFSRYRTDLISKQKELYGLAGLDEEHFCRVPENYTYEAVDESQEEASECEQYDSGDLLEDDSQGYIEDTIMCEEQIQEEDDENEETVLKIENVEAKGDRTVFMDDGNSGSFDDYLEEVIGVECDNQKNAENPYTDYDAMISCDLCGIEVPKNHLKEHVRVMHKTFACSQCVQNFQSKIILARHTLEIHGTDKVFRSRKRHFCPLCPKDYDYKKQLDDHIRSYHDKERNSQCHICHKSFYHRDLKKHIEHVHGEKNVSCEECGKMFTCVENLKLHMRYHQPPSFICTQKGCKKAFHQKVLLEHHEKKHSDIKPYVCKVCPLSFFSERDRNRHNQRVHEKVFKKCFYCDKQFSRKDKLRKHFVEFHKDIDGDERDGVLDTIRKMDWNS